MVCWSKGIKVTSCRIWRSQEKVCHLAPATLEPVSPDSSCTGVKPFSKFDRQQLCSPLTYRPHIYSINRSKPFKKVCQISRLCCLLLGPLWQLKVPLVYFINGQKGDLVARHSQWNFCQRYASQFHSLAYHATFMEQF